MLTVALSYSSEDAAARDVAAHLQEESEVIRYVTADSADAAIRLVKTGKADAAWIFPDNLIDHIRAYLEDTQANGGFVRVVEREEDVLMLFSRERLSGALYRCCTETLYLDYIREHFAVMDGVSDAQLLTFYQNTAVGGEMFTFADIDMAVDVSAVQQTHYLRAPVRGLLGAVILLAGLATALYYYRDLHAGTFACMRHAYRPFAEFGCQAVSVVNVAAATVLSLMLSGLGTSWWREMLTACLYGCCVASCCMMLRRLCGSAKVLAACLPMLIVAMLLICPVFFDISELHGVQLLLPLTYYIHAAYNSTYLWLMPLYTGVCLAVYWLLGKFPKRT